MTNGRALRWVIGLGFIVVAAAGALAAVGYRSVVRPAVIFQTESAFGDIFVTEDRSGVRSLFFGTGGARQGAARPGLPTRLEVAYMRAATVGHALTPKLERVLFVGLGVGAMPMYTRALWPEAQIDVVEIDSVVVDVAQRYFAFEPDALMRVHVRDGRAFVEEASVPSYDLIVLDAYSDEGIPQHLTTHEFLSAVRERLTESGVVVANLWASSPLYGSMLATFENVFGTLGVVEVSGGVQRIVVVVNDERPLDERTAVAAARTLARQVDLGFELAALVQEGYTIEPRSTGPVLYDEGNR